LPGLRRDLAAYYRRVHGVELDPQSEILVTASGVQALNVGIRCLLNPGDEALVLTPAWPNGSAIIRMDNAAPVEVPLPLQGGRYVVDFDALQAALTPRTRLLVYTSPSNPLGWVATEAEQEGLLAFARRHDLWLLADEVYDRLYYAGPGLGAAAHSILRKATREDGLLVAQSFSKTFCMTGWRLGWLVARRDVVEKGAQLNEFIVSHATSFIQRAAQSALTDGEPEFLHMLERLKGNRDFCLDALRRMPGVTVPSPDGAFYVFPRIDGLTDSFAFCWKLLHESRVGIAPGVAFGAGGEGSVRICYAAERAILEPAMERLARFLSTSWD
jgi:aspartate/methionine/tyrosine aminotransferase